MRRVVCCSGLVNCWMLLRFNSTNLVRKAWILVFSIGYVNWGIVFVGGIGGFVDCKLGWEVEGH